MTTMLSPSDGDEIASSDQDSFAALSVRFLLLVQRELEGDASASSKGRTILMVLYLCVLTLCFVTPVIYYCRLQYEDRGNHRLRELEAAGIAAALEQSQQQQHHTSNREEARAVRRKYNEERRARILQLFLPVRMILKEEHFVLNENPPSPRMKKPPVTNLESIPEKNLETTSQASFYEDAEEDEKRFSDNNKLEPEADLEFGESDTMSEPDKAKELDHCAEGEHCDYPYGEDESLLIRIPTPGLHLRADHKHETRLIPGLCTICLCVYEVGSDIVWSSNSACEHAFHATCIEQWLMKQREGPLCPCCRRDFIVDPFDSEDDIDSVLWIQRAFSDEGNEPPATSAFGNLEV